MKTQGNIFQTKEEDKTSEKVLDERERNILPDEEFQIMGWKMLTKVRRRIDEHSENFNKDTEKIKYQTEARELKNTITGKQHTLEMFNSRLDKTEKWISSLEEKSSETHKEQWKEKKF